MRSAIELAKEAGFDVDEGLFPFEATEDKFIGTERHLERFAALVRAEYEKPLKLAGLVEASVEECMGDDGMVAVIPLDLYNDLMAAIREALADHSGDANEMVYSKPSVFDGVCCGCAKKSADGWALYCVECWEKSNGDPFAASGKPIECDGSCPKNTVCYCFQRIEPVNPNKLADASFEPVAWAYIDADGSFMDALDRQHGAYQTPLYAAPVQPVKQEPVAWIHPMDLGRECSVAPNQESSELLPLYAAPVDAKAIRAEECERICAAIKAEDDYCIDNGDYMLDSNDCIKVARGEWVRPDFDPSFKAKNK